MVWDEKALLKWHFHLISVFISFNLLNKTRDCQTAYKLSTSIVHDCQNTVNRYPYIVMYLFVATLAPWFTKVKRSLKVSGNAFGLFFINNQVLWNESVILNLLTPSENGKQLLILLSESSSLTWERKLWCCNSFDVKFHHGLIVHPQLNSLNSVVFGFASTNTVHCSTLFLYN